MRRKRRNKLLLLSLSFICTIIIIVSTIIVIDKNNKEDDETGSYATKGSETAVQVTTEEPTTVKIPDPVEISLMMIGDNLVHPGVYRFGMQADGSYNFDHFFDGIKKYIDAADIKVLNQETIMAGNDLGLNGYPKFNTPVEMADGILNAGFNVVLHASNHTKDMGLTGLANCIAMWKTKKGAMVLGVNETEEEYKTIRIMEVKGARFALLNYTYSLNSKYFLSDKDNFKINALCDINPETREVSTTEINSKVLSDIKKAKELADFVIVFPHWGKEYTNKPTDEEVKWAKQMTEAGANLIIGTHPHVIQPVEWVTADNGNKALCYYSLGNYASTQDMVNPMLGALAVVKLEFYNGKVTIKDKGQGTGIIPIVNHYEWIQGWPTYKYTIPLSQYTEELAAKHGLKIHGGVVLTKDAIQKISDKVLKDWVLE